MMTFESVCEVCGVTQWVDHMDPLHYCPICRTITGRWYVSEDRSLRRPAWLAYDDLGNVEQNEGGTRC